MRGLELMEMIFEQATQKHFYLYEIITAKEARNSDKDYRGKLLGCSLIDI